MTVKAGRMMCPFRLSINTKELRQRRRKEPIKQSLCTCVSNFDTFLCRPLQTNNVKRLYTSFCGEREHTTVDFSFSFLT